MLVLEVFLRNTTTKMRWLVAQCSCATQALAEQVSADVNAELVLAYPDHPWMWPFGIWINWRDVVRATYVREAYATRKCDTSVWTHCFHLMHICGHIDTQVTIPMCTLGDIDVIAHAIKNTARATGLSIDDLGDLTYVPAILVTRRGIFIELAFDVIMILLAMSDKKHANAACEQMFFAAYLTTAIPSGQIEPTASGNAPYASTVYTDDIGDTIASCVGAIWPNNTMMIPNPVAMRCAARCQRGDISVTKEDYKPEVAFILHAAMCGGNLVIVQWCAELLSEYALNYAVELASIVCGSGGYKHVSLDTWKLVIPRYTGDIRKLSKDIPDEYMCAMLERSKLI